MRKETIFSLSLAAALLAGAPLACTKQEKAQSALPPAAVQPASAAQPDDATPEATSAPTSNPAAVTPAPTATPSPTPAPSSTPSTAGAQPPQVAPNASFGSDDPNDPNASREVRIQRQRQLIERRIQERHQKVQDRLAPHATQQQQQQQPPQ